MLKINNNKTKKKSKRIKNGGKAIDSGGYGCIFFPQLTCKNKRQEKNYVTKLMIKKDGKIDGSINFIDLRDMASWTGKCLVSNIKTK